MNSFFDSWPRGSAQSRMTVNGLSAVLNLPRARVSAADNSESLGLPEYAARLAYMVEDYPAAQGLFPASTPGVNSFFVPVQVGRGLWLDFNPAANDSTQHLAIVVDVQGINAITARSFEDRGAPVLEKYVTKCPVHGQAFCQNRRCASCGWDWPGQNYVPTNGTPDGQVWLDGFRLPTGEVRQFVFTEDEQRGVAAAKIGAQRDFALRITFYESSQRKPTRAVYRGGGGFLGTATLGGGGYATRSMSKGLERGLDIAAGAKIRQRIYDDLCDINSYAAKPAGQILISYVTEELAREILNAGKRPEASEGPLAGLPTGHRPQGPHQQF